MAPPDEPKTPAGPGASSEARRRSLLRFAGRRSEGVDAAALAELEAELALLREENARLKVERHQPTDSGQVVDRMRALVEQAETTEQTADDAWHSLTEALVLRETLLDVCREVASAMGALERRLSAIQPTGDAAGWLEQSAEGAA